jgi:hypothetical protein
LVFHDEFDQDGEPDPNYWTYDLGHQNWRINFYQNNYDSGWKTSEMA